MLSLPKLIDLLSANGYKARFLTENMQFNKDGIDTLHSSIAISKDVEVVSRFTDCYADILAKCSNITDVKKGEWKELCILQDY